MTFCTFPDVCRPSNLIMSRPPQSVSGGTIFVLRIRRPLRRLAPTSSAARLVRNGVHFDLGIDDCTRLDGRAGQHGILEVFSEYLVIAAEVAGIAEIGRDAHDIGQCRPFFGENSTNRLDRALRLFLVPEIMLPSASLATWPETKMKSPARTAG